MRLDDERESSNVEDRRRSGGMLLAVRALVLAPLQLHWWRCILGLTLR